ncbi:glycosyltransferase [Planctomycetota bacterium]
MQSKPIQVVHIIEGFLGGTSTYFCAVLPQLVQRGFEVTLICSLNRCEPNAPALISKLRDSGVTVHIIPMQREINPLKDIYLLIIILRLLLKNKYDIVHTHCSKAGAIGRIAAVLAGKKIRMHTPHCFAFLRCRNQFGRWIYLTLEQLLGKLTTKFVVVSCSEMDTTIRYHITAGHKCIVVNNSLSRNSVSTKTSDIIKASFGIAKNTRVVSTACRLVDYKGLFRFIEAAKFSRAHDTVFLIAGDGKLKDSIERFICKEKLNSKVRFLGYIPDMESIYAISDIIALCSDAEAQPYLLLEAMRAKCPIVATLVTGNKDLISPNETGVLTDLKSESIAESIDQLLANRKKRREYSQKAYNYFLKHHLLEDQVSKLTKIYKNCIVDRNCQYAATKLTTK